MRGKGKPSGKDQPTGCMAFFISLGRSVNQRLAAARNALRRKFRRNNNDLRPLAPKELENETGTRDLVIELKPVGPVKAEKMRGGSSPTKAFETDCAQDVPSASAEKSTCPETELNANNEKIKTYVSSIIQFAVVKVKSETGLKENRESESLTSSAVSEIADLAVRDSLSKVADAAIDNGSPSIRDTAACDASATTIASSEISQIAEIAVKDSLSKIASSSLDNANANIRDKVVCDTSATSIGSSELSQIADLAVKDSLSKIGATSGENSNANARRPRTVNEMLEYYGIQPTVYTDGMPRVDI